MKKFAQSLQNPLSLSCEIGHALVVLSMFSNVNYYLVNVIRLGRLLVKVKDVN